MGRMSDEHIEVVERLFDAYVGLRMAEWILTKMAENMDFDEFLDGASDLMMLAAVTNARETFTDDIFPDYGVSEDDLKEMEVLHNRKIARELLSGSRRNTGNDISDNQEAGA